MVTTYTVQLPVYQGPLDLLLSLIERAELDISKVSLSLVTDQYLDYLKSISEHDLEDLASFLVIAARLLQMKSEALLPRPPQREIGEEDPGDALARQLIAYKKYKQIAILLQERDQAGLRTYLRLAPVQIPEPQLDISGLKLIDLRRAMIEALLATPDQERLGKVLTPIRFRVKDKIEHIIRSLRTRGKATFRELVTGARTRLELVVSFLAILELVKLSQIAAEQENLFGEIELRPGTAWVEDQELDLELEFE